MNVKQRRRAERAAERLVAVLEATEKVRKRTSPSKHQWKSEDGKEKAQTCLANLRAKGIAQP